MNIKQFNEQRYNRKKQQYHFILGLQQLVNYPVLNVIWILLAIGGVFLEIGKKCLIENVEVSSMLVELLNGSMTALMTIFIVICVIGAVQFVGDGFSIEDEADMEIVFSDKQNGKKYSPILMYKKKDRKTGITKREFYTTIPMERWQEKKEDICDRMDIRIIGDITYGGKKKNKGNHIYFESVKGRNPEEGGILYDDTF